MGLHLPGVGAYTYPVGVGDPVKVIWIRKFIINNDRTIVTKIIDPNNNTFSNGNITIVNISDPNIMINNNDSIIVIINVDPNNSTTIIVNNNDPIIIDNINVNIVNPNNNTNNIIDSNNSIATIDSTNSANSTDTASCSDTTAAAQQQYLPLQLRCRCSPLKRWPQLHLGDDPQIIVFN